MLREVGFDQVDFFADRSNKVQAAQPHPLPGYILATGIEANGRIVAQAYPGSPDPDLTDGARVFVDDALLDRSVSTALLRAGAGFWPREDIGVDKPDKPDKLADPVIFPKLYRRPVDYFTDQHTNLAAFDTWIRAKPTATTPRTSTTSTRSTPTASACASSPSSSSSSNDLCFPERGTRRSPAV